MKKQTMKTAALVMAAALFLCGCGGKTGQTAYGKEILSALTVSDDLLKKRLDGKSTDVCIVEDEDSFDPEYVSAECAALFDDTDKSVLYAKNSQKTFYPASMTKCMTALLVLENCSDLDAKVKIDSEVKMTNITGASSMANLITDASYTVHDLLVGLLVPSGNDAANVLADYVGGDIDSFVGMMNDRAYELGMFDTHFANPNGLHDASHYTTAYDLYLLMRECLQYEVFQEIASAKEMAVTCYYDNNTTDIFTYTTGNSILKGYTEIPAGMTVLAAKTGYTPEAGRCLVLAARGRNGHTYISVLAHADGYDTCFNETSALLSLAPES